MFRFLVLCFHVGVRGLCALIGSRRNSIKKIIQCYYRCTFILTGSSCSLVERWFWMWCIFKFVLIAKCQCNCTRNVYGAQYTHHTFTPIIKPHYVTTTGNIGVKTMSLINKCMRNPTDIKLHISHHNYLFTRSTS